jgi:solute carrier family 45 protein 1/2/4
MTYCTPYLLRLGLTKDKVSLVWLAGPLSGLIMQPIVGILADKSTSPWGRRRPFMFIGTLIVCFSLFILGWTSEVVSVFITEKETKSFATIVLAVLSIYGIDFAINAVQASMRSLISDTLPLSKQQAGSAWASRMVAIGGLIGYGFGALDLTKIFGNRLGDSQLKQLIIVAGFMLVCTVSATCWAVTERVLITNGKDEDSQSEGPEGVTELFKQIWTTALNLPDRIAAICWVQFWCWIGWFPFLFYSTTWLGEVYLRFNAPADAKEHPDSVGQIGRVGSTALIVFSIVTFASSVIMPWFIDRPAEEANGFTPRPPESIAWIVETVQKHKPTLVSAWSYSHVIFAGSMFAAPFVTSLRAATTIVALCGM